VIFARLNSGYDQQIIQLVNARAFVDDPVPDPRIERWLGTQVQPGSNDLQNPAWVRWLVVVAMRNSIVDSDRARFHLRKDRQKRLAGGVRHANKPCTVGDVFTQGAVMKRLVKAAVRNRMRHQNRNGIVIVDDQSRIARDRCGIGSLANQNVDIGGIQAWIKWVSDFACKERTKVHGRPGYTRNPKRQLCNNLEVLRRQGPLEEPVPKKIVKMPRIKARQLLPSTE